MLDASNLRRLLVVDPCDDCRRLLPGLREAGWAVDSCALETARERACDVGLLRLRPFHLERPETVKDLISRSGTEWIAVLSPDTLPLNGVGDFVCEWFFDFHTLPFDMARVQVTLGRAFGMARLRGRGTVPGDAEGEHELLGESLAVRDLRRLLAKLAPTDSPVLIRGESGTGKELVARTLHRQSRRADKPFVAINCGAIPEHLIQSELFGHEKGAFTGALAAKAGWFEEANGGTLFLDEIGDLPMPIQVKLLRVLQEREVVRLGSRKSIPIDVRVLAATNVQLERAINAGHFREDLYYRLNVVSLELSPLRERPGDILPLTRHFIAEYSRRLGYGQSQLSPEAAQKLRAYSWPGNIRELENVIHHTLLICRDGLIRADDLHLSNLRLERGEELARGVPASGAAEHLLQQAFQRLFEEQGENLHGRVEDALLRAAYRFCHGNQVHTANLLGLSRNVTRTRLIAIGELVVNKRGGQRIDGERAVRLSI